MTETTNKRHPLVRLMQYARPYRGKIWGAAFSSIMNKFWDVLPPILIGMAIDVIVQGEASFLGRMGYEDKMTQLWIVAGLSLVVYTLESLFEYIGDLLWRNVAQSVQHTARMDAYTHVQTLEMAYFEDRSTGGLMSILNDDINQLERFLDTSFRNIIQLVFSLVVTGAWALYVAPSVAWWAIIPMPLIGVASIWFQRFLTPHYTAMREAVGFLNGQLNNNLSGISTIKSYSAEKHEVQRIEVNSNAYRAANHNAIRYSAAFIPLIRMVIVFGFAAIMVGGGRLVLEGNLAVGLYSTLIFMSQRLLWPLTNLGQTLDQYQRGMASTVRLLDLLDTEPQIVDGPYALPTPQVRGEVVFDDVSFAYSNGTSVIHNLSFSIPAGKTVALVGSTGSGKSTVIKLLLRFYDVTGGRILVDGVDVRELVLDDLHDAIGLVSQEVYLFHGSAAENIRYGTFEADDAAVIEAARMSEAHQFISELPQGYESVVGERGQKLSGGQRQRISIARAVVKDPPILVLDEATSAVDNETEAAIQRSLEKLVVGRTTIIIAHRLSTVRNADVILVLDKGRVVEQGKHEELLVKNGNYADLWRIQTGEQSVEVGQAAIPSV